MREDQVEDHDDDRRSDHRPRRSLAYFQRIALGVVAVEGRHGGDDEGEEAGFDERIDDRIEFEIVEQSRDVVVGDHDAREDGDHPAAGDADQNAQDRQERKEEHRSHDAELTPMISSASICSVMRIVPISEAMFDPTLPASMSATTVEENSRIIVSRVA